MIYLLPITEQEEYGVIASKILDNELEFLSSSDNLSPDLLLGHLRLMNVLLTCEGVDKQSLGHDIIQFLLDEFLFCASKCSNANTSLLNASMVDINSYNATCRKEAFNLLLTLADQCPTNICEVAEQLVARHHSQMNSKDWDVRYFLSSFVSTKKIVS